MLKRDISAMIVVEIDSGLVSRFTDLAAEVGSEKNSCSFVGPTDEMTVMYSYI
jgi:hypothetical protein